MTPQVLFLHGPAAAGKHTIGTLLSEQLGIPLFHNHLTVDLAGTLFDFGSREFVELREAVWKLSFQSAASAGRSFIFTFHPEATVRPALIDELGEIVAQHGGTVLFIELYCSDAEVERRIGNESRSRFGKLKDPVLFRELKKTGGFDFAPLPAPLISVDTERCTPEQSTRAIVEALQQTGSAP